MTVEFEDGSVISYSVFEATAQICPICEADLAVLRIDIPYFEMRCVTDAYRCVHPRMVEHTPIQDQNWGSLKSVD